MLYAMRRGVAKLEALRSGTRGHCMESWVKHLEAAEVKSPCPIPPAPTLHAALSRPLRFKRQVDQVSGAFTAPAGCSGRRWRALLAGVGVVGECWGCRGVLTARAPCRCWGCRMEWREHEGVSNGVWLVANEGSILRHHEG